MLDTRFNGGGNLVEALTVFLSGRTYATNVPRGQKLGTEPFQRWTKPSIVVMNEGNYSDAHCFPMAYTQLGIGETVGHAGAGHVQLRVVGAAAEPRPRVRHPRGGAPRHAG